MNKEKHKKLTFDDIVNRKLQREQDKMKLMSIYIPSMGGELIFNSIPDSRILEMKNNFDDNDPSSEIELARSLIYESCKDLQNPELHKMMGVSDPLDVVREIFTYREANDIGLELLKFNGFTSDDKDKIVSSIKNS